MTDTRSIVPALVRFQHIAPTKIYLRTAGYLYDSNRDFVGMLAKNGDSYTEVDEYKLNQMVDVYESPSFEKPWTVVLNRLKKGSTFLYDRHRRLRFATKEEAVQYVAQWVKKRFYMVEADYQRQQAQPADPNKIFIEVVAL